MLKDSNSIDTSADIHNVIKFNFSEKATKICVIFVMVLKFLSKRQNHVVDIKEGNLEAKTECYGKDKLKSPPFLRSFYDDF